jgi:hypothetical protein
MKKIRLLIALSLILKAALFSQDISEAPQAGGTESIFFPFVSRLQGEIKNTLLRLSWIDSPSVRGPVFIYRSVVPIEEISPASRGRPIEVPYGAESYIDEIEGPGVFYYFVIASDEWGQKYEISMPLGNSIRIEVSEQGLAAGDSGIPLRPQTPVQPQVPAPAPPSSGEVPAIRGIMASAEGGKVTITFSAAEGKRPVLYRSARPFTGTGDLLNAVIVQPNVVSPFIDYPVPGISYYYAVIPEADIIKGTLRLIPGLNVTTQSVEAAADRSAGLREPGLRSLPLPQISLQTAAPGMNAFSETPPRVELSPEAAKVLGNIPASGNRTGLLKKPRVFTQDLEPPSGGEEHILRSIVQGSFSRKDWTAARDELIRYLSLPRSSLTEARARFYLGQCRYFTGAYRESLFEFLLAESAESAEWIQSVLSLLTGN